MIICQAQQVGTELIPSRVNTQPPCCWMTLAGFLLCLSHKTEPSEKTGG